MFLSYPFILSYSSFSYKTLILDCCHSAGMNRAFSTDWTARYISKPPPISGAVDRHLCSTASRGLKISKDLQAMASSESHILLAACSSKQYARESKCAGHFTTALLEVLMKHPVHTLTYMSLINRLVMPIVKSRSVTLSHVYLRPSCVTIGQRHTSDASL